MDVDDIVIRYPSPVDLVEHLRNIGEGNASSQRRKHLPRDTALAAAALYGEMFGGEGEGEGVEATFQASPYATLLHLWNCSSEFLLFSVRLPG